MATSPMTTTPIMLKPTVPTKIVPLTLLDGPVRTDVEMPIESIISAYKLDTTLNKIFGNSSREALDGTAKADLIVSGGGLDTLRGGDGNDVLIGVKDAVVAYGGLGDDKLIGDKGDDVLHGEYGNDTIEGGRGADKLYGGNGADNLDGGFGSDRLYGAYGNDILKGYDGDDNIFGEAGNDRLFGELGSDSLNGGIGADVIFGGDGNDYVNGGSGNDKLFAGEGLDWLAGGSGADIFNLVSNDTLEDVLIFHSGDSGTTKDTMDTVIGFKSGEDKVELTTFFDRQLGVQLQWDGKTVDASGKPSVAFDKNVLSFDIQGDGVVDMKVLFENTTLTFNDFIGIV